MPDPTVPPYASIPADYAPTSHPDDAGALVVSVAPESPADDLGLVPGMRVLSANGRPLTDMIVWLWETDGTEVDLEVFDPSDGTIAEATMERFEGEPWGVEFDGAVFDGIRTCVNACLFCFMGMLPKEHRSSLSLRDDDYRLSFLQGNFVTLTNMSDAEVDDAIEKMLSPMNVSLHAISPDVRRRLIGRNAARGIEVLERLMDAGIEIHAQIVLCPGINDGDELRSTLDWVEDHPLITSLAIVPLGFTKYSTRFSSSFSDDVHASRRVVELIEPYQRRSRERFGTTRFQLSDEFYIDAELDVPPADAYDGFPQFYDGIGMIRSFLDDTESLGARRPVDVARARESALSGTRSILICGEAAAGAFSVLARELRGDADGTADGYRVLSIKNRFFGGNVNVTGLICACDLAEQLPADLEGSIVLLPSIIFNYDGLTLDGATREEVHRIVTDRGGRPIESVPAPDDMLDALLTAIPPNPIP
ncbi:MAG: DUF512 domain-containing protein [Collinsella sp.]|nr:DUF512 domain-containing protein [Collinsella sp.]